MNDLDKITASEDLKSKTLLAVMHKKKRSHLKIGAMILVTCLIVLVINIFKQEEIEPIEIKPYAYVSIDINPSMELQLNEKDTVIDIVSYNEEAKDIIDTLDIKGLPVQEAISVVINNQTMKTYFQDGFMQVGVYSEDEQHSLRLETELNTSLSNKLETSQYSCMYSTKDNYEQAISHHVSFGKYQVITMIIENSNYAIAQLQDLSMIELKNIYEEITGESLSGTHGEGHKQHQNQGGRHR
jgi:hypothetical protein